LCAKWEPLAAQRSKRAAPGARPALWQQAAPVSAARGACAARFGRRSFEGLSRSLDAQMLAMRTISSQDMVVHSVHWQTSWLEARTPLSREVFEAAIRAGRPRAVRFFWAQRSISYLEAVCACSGGIWGILLDRISCKPDGGSAGHAGRVSLTQTGRAQGAWWAGRIAAARSTACARAHILGPPTCAQRRCGGSQGQFCARSQRNGGPPPPARLHARRPANACLKHFQQPAPTGGSSLAG
jgi:hypothetical protein